MNFNYRFPKDLKSYYEKELEEFKFQLKSSHYQVAWRHLERAHIIGQAYPIQHSRVHWIMLKFGFRIKNYREVIGQIPRLLVGGVKSFVGKIPVGNTGGSNVPPLMPMEIPEDLKQILAKV
jgi:hypothetical protein